MNKIEIANWIKGEVCDISNGQLLQILQAIIDICFFLIFVSQRIIKYQINFPFKGKIFISFHSCRRRNYYNSRMK